MAKELITHSDMLGRELKVGDTVAYPSSNQLIIGTIRKFNPKMIKVGRVGPKGWRSEQNKYPTECVLLDGPDVTMYLLKNAGN